MIENIKTTALNAGRTILLLTSMYGAYVLRAPYSIILMFFIALFSGYVLREYKQERECNPIFKLIGKILGLVLLVPMYQRLWSETSLIFGLFAIIIIMSSSLFNVFSPRKTE